MTNTENYNLNLPDADDFCNIEDINENMETIDAAMFSLEENIGQAAEKIGSSADTGTETVMAKLNTVIWAVGSGMSAVKSVQSGRVYANTDVTGSYAGKLQSSWTSNEAGYIDFTISPVSSINKCQVDVSAFALNRSGNLYGYLTSTTNLRVMCYPGPAGSKIENSFLWQVTEFN